MTESLIPFSFEGTEVRVFEHGGDPWWIHGDVCRVLDIAMPHRAADRLDEDEKGRHIVTTLGGPQEMTIINESGLWSLVLTSRKPAAKRFKKWITSEVIPAIRKTGGYLMAVPEETPEALAVRALTVLQATIDRQKAQLSIAQPMADALEDLASLKGFHTLTQSAKSCGWPRDEFIQECNARHWIYRDKAKRIWMGYADKEKAGLLDYKPFEYTSSDGHVKAKPQVVFTARGLAKIKLLIGVYPGKSAPVPFSRPKEAAS